MGEFSARKIRKNKQNFKWKDITYRARMMQFWKKDPLEGSPQARGIVLEKRVVEQKQPSSGLIKCVRVQIVKNGVGVTAWVPGTGAIDKVNEHDEVMIESIGGAQGGAMGDTPGLKWKVIGVNGVSLDQILSGKKQKPTR